MEQYHPTAAPELQAPDFVEAVTRFRSAVEEFTAAVDKLDSSIAAAIEVFKGNTDTGPTGDFLPSGYHPPA